MLIFCFPVGESQYDEYGDRDWVRLSSSSTSNQRNDSSLGTNDSKLQSGSDGVFPVFVFDEILKFEFHLDLWIEDWLYITLMQLVA